MSHTTSKYVISEETQKRCHIFDLSPEAAHRFAPISLELFDYFFYVAKIDFSIYFRVDHQMIEFIKPDEFSHELVSRIVESRNKDFENLDICIEKKHYPRFQNIIERVRDQKIKQLLEKDPKLDRTTIQQFANLSNASQMIIKGGIDRHVALHAEAVATQAIDFMMDSEVAIGTLSRMILADPTLYDHSASVAMISGIISRKIMHKPKAESKQITLSGLYHDVGKSCIPTHILNKPGAFTPEEFEIMKEHTVLGYEELIEANAKGAPIEAEVALVALEHHERYCGHGYPHGKAGRLEENANGIHEFSRVVMIADVYSALLMKRVYKEAYEPAKALEIMQKNAHRDYDPEIFSSFLKSVVKSLGHFRHLEDSEKKNGRIIFIEDHTGSYKKSS